MMHQDRTASAGIEALGFCARPVIYRYRYCPTCRREWPARHSSCPTCVRWLGDQPLERTEWQIAPLRENVRSCTGYEHVVASAVVLRLIADSPTAPQIQTIAAKLGEALCKSASSSICPVPTQGWLIWSTEGLRPGFRQALDIEQRLAGVLGELEGSLHIAGHFRWGVWLDQYVLRSDQNGAPLLPERTAKAIFNFEPDNLLLCSEAVYDANRYWEHFVCVPRRLLNGEEHHGYRFLGHKQPSALDHANAPDSSPFVGRDHELDLLTACYQQSRATHIRTALIAEAGSGKTRLVRAWRQLHPEVNFLLANFSLFGGDLPNFVGQLTTLPDPITLDTLLGAVVARVETEQIDVLVLDDLHWADPHSAAFLQRLLDALSQRRILVLLITRPSGQTVLEALKPTIELRLEPLSSPIALDLARRVIHSPRIALIAARRSKGNPLFIEQFAAWAVETDYTGAGDAPRNLHQTIAARIAHLCTVRLAAIRQRLRWGSAWERGSVQRDLDQLENEIGLWLDRLETGDYGDRVEVSRHLIGLERLDFEIFLACTLAGRRRARSSRLREAIERLLSGSADQILADLQRRAVNANEADKANILHEAQRAGDVLAARYDWHAAAAFYALALRFAQPEQRDHLADRLAACRRRQGDGPITMPPPSAGLNIETDPSVDALRLPEVWVQLGEQTRCAEYFRRAAMAAQAINDSALAEWARHCAARLPSPSP